MNWILIIFISWEPIAYKNLRKMTGVPRKRQVFHWIKLMTLGINRMCIENHRIICGQRGKNPNQPINSPFTAWDHSRYILLSCTSSEAGREGGCCRHMGLWINESVSLSVSLCLCPDAWRMKKYQRLPHTASAAGLASQIACRQAVTVGWGGHRPAGSSTPLTPSQPDRPLT